jgi:NAD(P)H dehydrogenase (quinone)
VTKFLVLYYSSIGHIEVMASAIAGGVREVLGAELAIKRVPELVPEEVARKNNFKLDQAAPIAAVAELPQYDAILFGTPTPIRQM